MIDSVQNSITLEEAVKDAMPTNGAENTPQQGGIKPWSIDEIHVGVYLLNDPKPIEFVIDKYLAKGTIGLLVGEGGIAKSLAAELLCVGLSCCDMIPDLKWLDRFLLTIPRKTLYLHLEDEINDFHRRFRCIVDNLLKNYNVPESQHEDIYKKIQERFFMLPRETALTNSRKKFIDKDGTGTDLLDRLLATCQLISPDLIIVDTRTKASSVDENHNSEAGDEIETWTKLRDKTGSSILIIAHTNKLSRSSSSGGTSIIRGASAYTDNSRFVVTFQYNGEKIGGNSEIEIKNPKNNHCRKVEDFTVLLEYPFFKQVESNSKKTDEVSTKSNPNSQQVRDILEYVTENPGCTQRQMIDAFFGNIPKTHLNKLCQQLIIKKQLVREKRGKAKEGYYVTTTTSTEVSESDAFLNLVEGTTQQAQVSCPPNQPETFPNFPEDSGKPSVVLSNPDGNEQVDLFTGAAPSELVTTPDSKEGSQPTPSAATSPKSNEPPIPPEPPLSLTPNEPEVFLGDSQRASSTVSCTEASETETVPDCTEDEHKPISPMEMVYRSESQDDPV